MKFNSIFILILSVLVLSMIGCENLMLSSNEVKISWTNSADTNFRTSTTAPTNSDFYSYGTISAIEMAQAKADGSDPFDVSINTLDFSATYNSITENFSVGLNNYFADGWDFWIVGLDSIDFLEGHFIEITVIGDFTESGTQEYTYFQKIENGYVMFICDDYEYNGLSNEWTELNALDWLNARSESPDSDSYLGIYTLCKIGIKSINFYDESMVNYYTWTNPGL